MLITRNKFPIFVLVKMGIVAAQCRVFITQNDICAPRPLYYHLFFLDNRHVSARSPPRRLLVVHPVPIDFACVPCRVSPLRRACRVAKRAVSPTFSPSAGVPGIAFRAVSCAIPARASLLVFSSVSRLSSSSSQSESRREGRSLSSNAGRPMPFCSPSPRHPVPFSCVPGGACRLSWRRHGDGERGGVLWNVSHETRRVDNHHLAMPLV